MCLGIVSKIKFEEESTESTILVSSSRGKKSLQVCGLKSPGF